MTQNTNPPTPEGPAHRFANHPGGPTPSTHPGAPGNETQWQAARAGNAGTPDDTTAIPTTSDAAGGPLPGAGSTAAQQEDDGKGQGDGRPSNLVLAGAGSLLAVLAFLGGTAVGHAWDGFNTQQNQGGPGGGGRQFPGFPGQQGQVPGQGTTGQGQGTVPGQGQGATGQGQGTTGQGQGTVPDQGAQPSTDTGQTQTG
jgi:hypothetical protein